MSLQRIKEYPYPDDFRGLPEANAWARRLHGALTEEASERLEDFDILKLANVGWADARRYGTSAEGFQDGCANAISATSTTNATLLIPNQQDITDDVTIPSNVTLKFVQSGSFNISAGKTVTINGHIEAGLYQIFEGAGSVVFGIGSVGMVFPEWWGAVPYVAASAVDCAVALQAGADTGIPVYLSALYESRSTIDFDNAYCQAAFIGHARVGRTDTVTHHDSGIIFTDDSIPGINVDFTTVAGHRRGVLKNIHILGSTGVDTNHSGVVIPEGRVAHFVMEECFVQGWGKHCVLIQGGTGIVELHKNGFVGCPNDYAIMSSNSAVGDVPPPDVIVDGGYIQGNCAGAIAIDTASIGVANHHTYQNLNIELMGYATKPLIYIKNSYGVKLDSIIMSSSVATVSPDDAMIVLDGSARSVTLENVQCYATGGLNNILINADVIGVNVIGGFYSNKASMGAGLGYFIYNKATNARLFVSYPTFGPFTTGRNIVYNDGVTPRMTVLSAGNCGYMNSGFGFGFGTLTPSTNADITLEDGKLCLKETTTPTADTNYGKIYTKNDDKLYFQDGAGNEYTVDITSV